MSKTKVLEVAFPALNNSGVPAVIMGIVRSLHSSFDFDVLVFRKEAGYHAEEFLSYGGQIYHIDSDKKDSKIINLFEKLLRPIRLYSGTRKILRAGNYDAIHCHNGFDSCWCLLAAKKEKVKVRVVHSHASVNPYEHRNLIVEKYNKFCVQVIEENATHFVAPSKKAGERLFGNSVRDMIRISNTIDFNKFDKDKYECIKMSSTRPVIAFVGRYSIEKNPLFVVDVFEKIHSIIAGAKLVMVGFGSLEESLKNRIHSLGLSENVNLYPHDSDVASVLSQSNIFIQPSQAEGFGIALLEAQAMGNICFASDNIPNEVDVGLCNFLSLEKGETYWAERIMDVIKNHDGDRTFPEKSKMNHFTPEYTSNQYANIFKKID